MQAMAATSSPLYLFEKFEVGVVHLDAQRSVLAMNDFARKVLPVGDRQPFNRLVESFHPDRARPKVNFMLDQATACPVANSVPMTMIINIPEQVLLIKVSRLSDEKGQLTGFVLVFYDVTQIVSSDLHASTPEQPSRRLTRIPTVANHKIVFLETADVLYLESAAHYTRVRTREGAQFCNLSIGDLEARLDPARFMRVHRCFIVNIDAIAELEREAGKTLIRLKGRDQPLIPVARTSVASLRRALGLPSRYIAESA